MKTRQVARHGASKRMKLARRALVTAMACFIAVMVGSYVAAYAALPTNYDWYKGHEGDASYTIATAGEMKALAKIVNGTADYDGYGGPVDFAGKAFTVEDPNPLNIGKTLNYLQEAIEPIGTAQHPFRGQFNGNGYIMDNFKLTIGADDASASVSNIGAFGYVGEGGSIDMLSVGRSSSITIGRSDARTEYVVNVGMVAGFSAGPVTNCSNDGTLTIASAVEQASEQDYIPVRNIGGVVGQCTANVAGCRNSGAISVSETATPDPDIRHGQLVARVGGVVGLAGDEARIGTYDNHIFGEADKHGEVLSCTNVAKIYVDTPAEGLLDRFNQRTNAESLAVGGVVGYSQGSVRDCTNGLSTAPELDSSSYRDVGYVRAENGCLVGGICGSLRGVHSDNTDPAWADDGADGADPLVMWHCTNYGDVYARVSAGGIAGKTSSYTTVTECMNMNKIDAWGNAIDSWVVATRWNKPTPAGIVGQANGNVSYCANFAKIASALWANEGARTISTQEGYYAAGIVGILTYFDDRAPANGGITTPVPEVFGCYNAGTVTSGAGMRQRGIVGQNDGYVHDNVLLAGMVDDDKIVYGDDPSDREASGTVGENRVYRAAELREAKRGEAVAFLNANGPATGWQAHWIISKGAVNLGRTNTGFPLLNWQDPWGEDALSITGATLSLVDDAPFTGAESTPTVEVTLSGQVLTANADYRVIPQEGAVDPSTGRPYRARVMGMGRYAGTSDQDVAYDIVAGDFSTCTLTAVAHTFDYEAQAPTADEVLVRTPAGTTVDSNEYTFAVVDSNDNPIGPIDAGTYRIIATANEGSPLFRGSLEGKFRVKPASFVQDVKFDDTTLGYLGETYPWVDSTEEGESDNPTTTLPYSGVPVKPAVHNVTYKGHELVEGVDYKVIYGNVNSDEGNTGDEDQNNVGKPGGRTVGCVTVRYVNGGSCNFSSYVNMFFNIVDDGSKIDLSHATYQVEGEQLSDGEELRPVELFLGAQKLTEGVDYAIAYESNILPGTATFTATGLGRFEGQLTGSFEIVSGDLLHVLYAYTGGGTDGSPLEATVTGVEYYGTRDAFSLEIPATVEHDGATYDVVAIGDNAFGGTGVGDFTGSEANESKLKLARISLPATVRSLGSCSFGSTSGNYTMKLQRVEFADGSALADIGDYAFARCSELKTLTVPAGVESIGRQAFAYCSSLESLRFMTRDASLPSSVAAGGVNGSFRECTGVTVYGYADAQAARKLAANNVDGTASGWNGGRGFSFVELRSIDDVAIEAVPDQDYTGAAIEPGVRALVGETRLVEGEDYELTYRDNVAAGTATVTVTGTGRWVGSAEAAFTIKPARMAKVECSALDDKLYDGNPAAYAPALTYLERRLQLGVDYTLSYADGSGNELSEAPTKVGSYRLVATGMGSFEGSRYRSFRIVEASIADATVGNVGQKDYTGAPIEPDPNVQIGGAYLERDVDYVVSYENNVERGQAQITVTGINGYVGSQVVTFNIVGSSLAGKAVVGGVSDVALASLDGGAVSFDPVVVCGGALLREGVDYEVSYATASGGSGNAGSSGLQGQSSGRALVAVGLDGLVPESVSPQADDPVPGETIEAPSEPGSYFALVKGKGNYRGSASIAFDIVDGDVPAKTDLSAASVVPVAGRLPYDGTAQMPAVTVQLNGAQLSAGTDYIASYANNVGPTGEGDSTTVVVHGIGNFTGSTAPAAFTIEPATIAADDVLEIGNASYAGGNPVTPAVVVKVGNRSLVQGSDFTVSYEANTAVGTARALVTGTGGYRTDAPVGKEFQIVLADVFKAAVTVEDRVYDGTGTEPGALVECDGVELVRGTDYTVSYADGAGDEIEGIPCNAGSYKLVVTGTGNYCGSIDADYSIAPRPIGGARVSAAPQTYTGSALKPEVTVRLDATILGPDDYTVDYANNVNAGTAQVTVTGAGNYTGSATGAFAVNARDLSGASVSVKSQTYTGTARKPAVTVKLGSATLVSGKDYQVTYTNNVKVGTATAKVMGIGNYAGTKSATFTIARAKQAITLKAKTPRVKASALKKAKRTIAASKSFTLKGCKGTVRYAKAKGSSAKLKINAKTGKITVAKGTKKGVYKIKVKVTSAKTANYLAATKTVTVKVKVV